MGKPKVVNIRTAKRARPASQTKKPTKVEAVAVAPKGRMVAPGWMPKKAGEHFKRIVKLLQAEGRASPSHVDSVALLAARLLEVEECNEALEGGSSYETTTDRSEAPLVRQKPEVGQRADAMRHAHSLLVELGLTPAAAHRMLREAAKEKEKEENEFNEFA